MNTQSPFTAPANVILFAAGRGNRLAEYTDKTHKSLLPINGRPAMGYALESIQAAGVQDVVVVTGYRNADIESFVRRQCGPAPRFARNERWEEDINILSVDLGVKALARPELGYLIVETDLIVEPEGWQRILDVGADKESYWVTRGTYSQSLTGGILKANAAGDVFSILYRPTYDPLYDGWNKLLGAVYVGPKQVEADRLLRVRTHNQ